MHRAGNPIAHSRHVAQRPRLHALRSSIAIAVAALEGVSPAQARSAFVCVHACTRATHPVCSLSLSSPFSSQEPATKGSRTANDKRRKRTLRRSKTTHWNGSVLCTSTRPAVQPHGERTRTRHREKSDGRESEENGANAAGEAKGFALSLQFATAHACMAAMQCHRVRGGTARPPAEPRTPIEVSYSGACVPLSR